MGKYTFFRLRRAEHLTNEAIADAMDRIADLLEIQHANPHRVRAYRTGAGYVRHLKEALTDIVRSGDGKALRAIPFIGEGLASLIEELVHTGKSRLLQRLEGEVTPEDILEQVPGIGAATAERIVRELGIHTLEDLEQAAHDGRLSQVRGFGHRRVEAVAVSLAGMLGGQAKRQFRRRLAQSPSSPMRPTVAMLLDVDAEYRRKARDGKLKKIAPRRFNPNGEAWLPVLHTERDDWSFTALYSNTARAHELEKTQDWVVIFFEKNGLEDQSTVVTETHGPLSGKRVVRGREGECLAFYSR